MSNHADSSRSFEERQGLTRALSVARTGIRSDVSDADAKVLGFVLHEGECDVRITGSEIQIRYSWLQKRNPSTYYGSLSPGLISQLMDLGNVEKVQDTCEFSVGPGAAGVGPYRFHFTKKWVWIDCADTGIDIRVRDQRKSLSAPLNVPAVPASRGVQPGPTTSRFLARLDEVAALLRSLKLIPSADWIDEIATRIRSMQYLAAATFADEMEAHSHFRATSHEEFRAAINSAATTNEELKRLLEKTRVLAHEVRKAAHFDSLNGFRTAIDLHSKGRSTEHDVACQAIESIDLRHPEEVLECLPLSILGLLQTRAMEQLTSSRNESERTKWKLLMDALGTAQHRRMFDVTEPWPV